jgi:hypothetical protein
VGGGTSSCVIPFGRVIVIGEQHAASFLYDPVSVFVDNEHGQPVHVAAIVDNTTAVLD